MELTDSLRALLIETAQALEGRARRTFMARTVKELGPGGQRLAERDLGWSRVTIRKGMRELEECPGQERKAAARGRRRAEEALPDLLADICAIVEQHRRESPEHPRDPRSAGLTPGEVRRRLIALKGYRDADLPTSQTIAAKLRDLGYSPRQSAPGRPRSAKRAQQPK